MFKKRLFAVYMIILISIFNMNFYVNANEMTLNSDSMVYLDFDRNTGAYTLTTENGKKLDNEEYSISKSIRTESVITTAVTTTPTVTSTTVTTTTTPISGVIWFTTATTVTTKPLSSATTVSDYNGRYRTEGRKEWYDYLDKYTTVTTTTTTTTTTKATTTTTTTTTTVSKSVYNGIDVSRHQGIINWKKVKETGIDFVMIRAGYGMEYDQVDGNFHANIKAAQSVGLECGVYWYSYALNTSEALQEAKVCYDTIKSYKLTYPVSFDIEDPTQASLSKTEISNITKTFCDYLESKNYYVSVYSYASMLNDKMNENVIGKYDIWVAHTKVSKPSFNHPYGMWQYSWTGSVNGITGDVDLDYAYKNYPYIIKNNHFSGY